MALSAAQRVKVVEALRRIVPVVVLGSVDYDGLLSLFLLTKAQQVNTIKAMLATMKSEAQATQAAIPAVASAHDAALTADIALIDGAVAEL